MVKRRLHPLSYILLCVFYSSMAIASSSPLQLLWIFVWAWLTDFREGYTALILRLSSLKKIGWLLISLGLIQLLFRRGGQILFSLGCFQVHEAALTYAAMIALRIMIIYLCASSLSKLDFSSYRAAFSKIRLPEELSFMVSYMAHLIPQLSARFRQQMAELSARGLRLKKLRLNQKLTIYRILALFTVADLILQSKRQATVLELRGFRSAGKSSSLHVHRQSVWDLAIMIWIALLSLSLIWL
jgi:energy-coupling factor transport system permease protein